MKDRDQYFRNIQNGVPEPKLSPGRSMRVTVLGYFAALAMMATLLIVPIIFILIIKYTFGI